MKKIKNLTGYPVRVTSFDRWRGHAIEGDILPENGVFGVTLPKADPANWFELGYTQDADGNTCELYIEHTGTLEVLSDLRDAVQDNDSYYLVSVDQYLAARRAGVNTTNFIFAEKVGDGRSILRFFDGDSNVRDNA